MKENTLRTRNKGWECSFGLTVVNTQDSGPMGNNMVEEHSLLSMLSEEMVSGTMERGSGGQMRAQWEVILRWRVVTRVAVLRVISLSLAITSRKKIDLHESYEEYVYFIDHAYII